MNNKCTKSPHFAVALLLCATVAHVARAQAGDDTQPPQFDAARTADQIITGLISEELFQQLDITADQRLDVWKAIKRQRGWTMPDEALEMTLPEPVQAKLSRPSRKFSPAPESSKQPSMTAAWIPGACNLEIHQEYGTTNARWPVYIQRAAPGECGPDNDDVVLVYPTPNYPRTNPQNIRLWHPLWWVRTALLAAYRPWGGLWANGLCGPVTHACVGSAGQLLNKELFSIYLWQK